MNLKNIQVVVYCLIVLAVAQNSYAEDMDWNRLVSCVIEVESGGNPDAYNKESGAVGLMQITPVVLEEFNTIENPKIVSVGNRIFLLGNSFAMAANSNIKCIERVAVEVLKDHLYYGCINEYIGTWYLHRLKDHYLKDLVMTGKDRVERFIECIIAAYNCGPTKLKKLNYAWWKIPETREYVKKVMKLYKENK